MIHICSSYGLNKLPLHLMLCVILLIISERELK